MARSSGGSFAPVRRDLPANLSAPQRQALELFLDGHISAGAFSSKLEGAQSAVPTVSFPAVPASARQPARTSTWNRPRRIAAAALLCGVIALVAYALASGGISLQRPTSGTAARASVKISRAAHHRRTRRAVHTGHGQRHG